MGFDIAIRDGRVIDGTGNPWFRADVGINDGKIVEVSRIAIKGANRVIDARGLVVAPGFIDIHSHTDMSVLMHNRCESSLHMGVTTMGGGQCGITMYPVTDKSLETIKTRMMSYAPDGVEVDWATLAEWRRRVESRAVGANLAPYIGHGTVRSSVMGVEGEGGERYEPAPSEMEEMKRFVKQAMEDGAFGMSTGLAYNPGRNAFTKEIIELAKIVAEYGGMYISHMRSESNALIEACKELIEICEKAGIRGCFSHHKAMFPDNWGKPCETMRLLDEARVRGTEIYCDVYPWTYGDGCSLGKVISTTHESREALLRDLKDPTKWAKIKKENKERYENEVAKNEERKKVLGMRGIAVTDTWTYKTLRIIVYSKTRSDLVGKNLGEVADAMSVEDFWDAARDLYIEDEGYTYCGGSGGMREEDVQIILKHPTSSISTDASTFDVSNEPWPTMVERLQYRHPRGWGSYPRVLQKYVREQKILRLEEAIRKMTSLPAQFLEIKDRGFIKEGMWADVTLFDPENIMNRATYATPTLYPDGISYVLVNGKIVIDKGEHTGALPGKVLFHKA